MNLMIQDRLPRLFSFVARLFFALTIILTPIRWRIVLLARPIPPLYADYTDFLLFAPDLAVVAVLSLWAITFLFHPRKISLGRAHIWIPLAGLTLAGWVSLGGSWDAPLTIYHVIRLSLLFLFFLYIVNEIHSLSWVVIPVGLQILVQSVVAVGQSLLQHDLGLQALGEYELNPIWQGVSVLEAGGVRFLRAYGLSDHPNILGGCLAFGLVILLGSFLHQKNRIGAWLTAGVMVPASVALFLTFSRSAWIAFLAGSVLLVGVEAFRRNMEVLKRVAGLALVCLLITSPLILRDLPYLRGRFNARNAFAENRVENGSLIERAFLFESANRIFVDHALTGIGLGASVVAMKQVYPVFPLNYQPPHFTLLAVAVETGLLGATFYFFLLIIPIILFILNRRDFMHKPELLACFALLLAVSIVGLFDYYTWLLVPGRLWQWLGWGIWSASLAKYELA